MMVFTVIVSLADFGFQSCCQKSCLELATSPLGMGGWGGFTAALG